MQTNQSLRPDGAPRCLAALLALFTLVSAEAATTEYFSHASFVGDADALTVVGFDDLAHMEAFSGLRYDSLGLEIVQRDARGQIAFNPSITSFYTTANRESALNVMSSGDFAGVDNFDFIFGHAVYATGLWIGNISPGTTEVQFLGPGGVSLVGEVLSAAHGGIIHGGGASWDNRQFYGIISDTPIERIRTIEPGGDSDGVTYDDVTFTAAEVPEAGTAGATALFAGLLFVRPRKRWVSFR